MKNTVAIILARGGSKSIPNKNIIDFCGKPLLAWSIENAKQVEEISSIWVSSDSQDILQIAKSYGANTICRPPALSTDHSSSETGWKHAINTIREKGHQIDLVIALQATSPLTEPTDIKKGIIEFKKQRCDSLFSASPAGDLTIWEKSPIKGYQSINFDYRNRKTRQHRNEQILENGAFYMFKPEILSKYNNRLGGKIGISLMEHWKFVEIDDKPSLKLCESIMKNYRLVNGDMGRYLKSMFSLEGKIAVVTGAARGNGKALAEALLRAGAIVILVDILEKELSATLEDFRDEKLKAFMYKCNITKISEIISLKDFILDKFHKIDILVNNAGVTHPYESLDYPDEFWEHTYKVNLKAPFELSKEIGKIMKKQRSGVIINITSLGAERCFPGNPAYGAFKAGLKHLSKVLALDLAKFGIRVNNIGPGYMRTEMTKKSWQNKELRRQRVERTILGRWGESKDLAGAVLFLSSNASSYVTAQDLYVDGGWIAKGL